MARVQVGGVSAPEALRTTLSPSVQMVQERMDKGAGTGAAQLAQALGIGGQIADQKAAESADAEARKVLNSMTIDELGKKLRSGELAPNQSPLFMATLNGMYGENLRSKLERDTLAKMETGELQFNTPEELDKYITDARSTYLEGADKFALRGFDSKFNQMRQGLLDAQGKVSASMTVERMASEATQFMLGDIDEFRKENPNASASDVAQHLMRLDTNLRGMAPLPPKVQKNVLKGVMNDLAARGEFDLLTEALKIKQPSGQTGATLIGMDTARQLLSIAENNFDKSQRQRVDGDITNYFEQIRTGDFNPKDFTAWYKDAKNSKYVSAGAINSVFGMYESQQRQVALQTAKLQEELQLNQALGGINTQINVALQQAAMGMPPADLPEEVTVGNKTLKPRKMFEERANDSIQQRLTANQITPSQATAELTTMGVDYAPWQQLFNRGASLVDSGSFQANGKPTEFNHKLAEAIDVYRQVHATSPSYAKKLAKGNAELFETLAFATAAGIPPEEAVQGFQNMKKFEGLDAGAKKDREKVAMAALEETLKPNWFLDFIPGVNQPSFPESYKARVRGLVDFYSKGYNASKQEVVELVKQNLSANSVVVAGKAYMNSDIPGFDVNPNTGRRVPEEDKQALRDRMAGILAAQVKQELALDKAPDPELMELRFQGDNVSVHYRGFPVAWRTQGTRTGVMRFTKKELEKIVFEREAQDAIDMATNAPAKNQLQEAERVRNQVRNRLN